MREKNLDRINTVARIGYSAKCIVYSILGILIVYAAFTAATTEDISKKMVFREILSTPFGSISLTAIIAGLACYVAWRTVQGITNPDDLDMKKPSKVILRGFYFGSALLYSSVTFVAIKVLLGLSDDSSEKTKQMGHSIMAETWGVVLIVIVSLTIMIFSILQLKHAVKGDFMDKFVDALEGKKRTLARFFGRVGFAARGVVYILVSGFYMHAAWTFDPDKAGGLGKALNTLLQQPFGPYLVTAVGLGMISFGIFCGFEGRYRKTR